MYRVTYTRGDQVVTADIEATNYEIEDGVLYFFKDFMLVIVFKTWSVFTMVQNAEE